MQALPIFAPHSTYLIRSPRLTDTVPDGMGGTPPTLLTWFLRGRLRHILGRRTDPQYTGGGPPGPGRRRCDLAAAAGVKLNIKGLRHYTASQLLAARFDLRNTAARLGHGSGGATTLRHYADPVSEVDRRAAAYLAQLTAGSAAQSD